jgi:hypothetical protein
MTVDLRTSAQIKRTMADYVTERRAFLDAGEWSRIQNADQIEMLSLAVNALLDELEMRGDLGTPTTEEVQPA